MFKRLLLSLSLFLVLFLNVAPFFPSHAQSPSSVPNPWTTGNETWYTQSFPTWFTKVFDDKNPTEIFGERYTAAQVQWVVYSLASVSMIPFKGILTCAFTQDVVICEKSINEALASIPDTNHYANSDQSFWQAISSRKSLSGIGYVKGLVAKFNPVSSAYAQSEGFGYNQMDIVRELWMWTRNLAFGVLVVIALYYSFMIMLRQKISPQAVISIETAIPKLIISALLVTFSFAIAGFLIDIMYVAGGIVAYIITGSIGAGGTGGPAWKFFTGSFGGVGIIAYMFLYMIVFFFAGLFSFIALATTGPINLVLSGLMGIVGLFVLLGIFVVVFINMFKILFMMIKTVANIYLAIIFSPLQLVMSGVSKNAGLGQWILNLLGNLAVFPLMLLFFVLAAWFLGVSFEASSRTIIFGNALSDAIGEIVLRLGIEIPQTFGVPWQPPFFGPGWDGFIFLGISFGLIAALPKAAEMAKSAIMKGTMDFESGIGETVKGAGGFAKRAGYGLTGSAFDSVYNTGLADILRPRGGATAISDLDWENLVSGKATPHAIGLKGGEALQAGTMARIAGWMRRASHGQ